tara:strand:+ start:350 stop:664 length:315 start_codon:yes stop_codon:yes gene_type:complete
MTKLENSKQCDCRDCREASRQISFGLTEVKFVGIDFDPKTIQTQQTDLNNQLQNQWQILKDVQTSNGLVFILGRFGEIQNSRSFQEFEPPTTALDSDFGGRFLN